MRGALGVTFDHALCDVGGVALLLSHVSARYAGEALPVSPHHEREHQPHIVTLTPAKAPNYAAAARPNKKAVPGGA
eukprot:479534-Prymnesium_polylepis.1